jgi:hypothetical protein
MNSNEGKGKKMQNKQRYDNFDDPIFVFFLLKRYFIKCNDTNENPCLTSKIKKKIRKRAKSFRDISGAKKYRAQNLIENNGSKLVFDILNPHFFASFNDCLNMISTFSLSKTLKTLK